MEREIHLTDDEVKLLGTILTNECSETREELRRTDNLKYKADVQQRLDLTQQILDKVERIAHTVGNGI